MPAKSKLTLYERFMQYVLPVPESGCWLWTGGLTRGYGQFRMPGRKSPRGSHCVSYELHVGPIPEGMDLDHTCRVPSCVNPKHLEPVPHIVNCRRGNAGKPQLSRTHCPRGHAYDETNTYVFKSGKKPNSARLCKKCHLLHGHKYDLRTKALKRLKRLKRLAVKQDSEQR